MTTFSFTNTYSGIGYHLTLDDVMKLNALFLAALPLIQGKEEQFICHALDHRRWVVEGTREESIRISALARCYVMACLNHKTRSARGSIGYISTMETWLRNRKFGSEKVRSVRIRYMKEQIARFTEILQANNYPF